MTRGFAGGGAGVVDAVTGEVLVECGVAGGRADAAANESIARRERFRRVRHPS